MKKYEQVLRYAMQMELDGHNFFKEKADTLENPTTKALFLQLAEVEMDHYNFIKRQLEEYLETNTIEIDNEILNRDEESIFETREKSEHLEETLQESDVPDLTVLRMAYLIERDYKEFYIKAAEKAEDENVKKLFEQLAKWEAGHEKIFKKEYDRRMEEYMNLPWGG